MNTLLSSYREFLIRRFRLEARWAHYALVVLCWVSLQIRHQVWPPWHPAIWIMTIAFPLGVYMDLRGDLPVPPYEWAKLFGVFLRVYAFVLWQEVASVAFLYLWACWRFQAIL